MHSGKYKTVIFKLEMTLKFAYNMIRSQLRMIFGPNHRFWKEYNEALDKIQLSSHWLSLYDSLEGPNAVQVCEAMKKWADAHQAKKEFSLSVQDGLSDWDQVLANEKQLKRDLHLLIYGDDYEEGVDGYVSEYDPEDDEDSEEE